VATTLTIRPPADYVLARDACSYGYFLLSPNHWEPGDFTFRRVLDLSGGPAALVVSQGRRPEGRGREAGSRRFIREHAGLPLRVRASRTLSGRERAEAERMLSRMLRLDEDEGVIAAFHRVDRRWRASGRGRVMRSPTLFEDVIRTVTSCNVTWPSTVNMNRRLCEVVGRGSRAAGWAFPTAKRLARARPGLLRARCSVGYRDQRIVELARLFAAAERSRGRRAGGLDLGVLENPATPDGVVYDQLIALPGIGPYAAANIMQLMGRYARLPLDTESIRHGRTVLGFEGTDRAVMERLRRHFAPFGEHAFRSYWFELWAYYEAKRGPAWTWERETTGKTFTAALLGA
jgi:3-methyladenine DNA glycosylase/8-oxoguanine DNA glycosylase